MIFQPNKDDFGSDPFAILHAPTSASQITSPGMIAICYFL